MASVAIQFKNVSKRFRIYHSGKQRFLSLFSAKYRRNLSTEVALSNVSFSVEKGEVVNIVGGGGSGKTTLLEVVSGVVTPNKGEVIVNGKVLTNLHSTLGFANNYNAYKNLRTKGALLGMPKEAIERTVAAAAEFSELGDKLNMPIITYSKAQRARLAPSFALAIKPDILLIDKTLAAGDAVFKRKCANRLNEILADPEVTALYVSTSPSKPGGPCKRAIIINHGKLVFDGSMEDAREFHKQMKAASDEQSGSL